MDQERDNRDRAAVLSDALVIWRGPALDDVPSRYVQDSAISQLEGERLAGTVELARTLLQLGEPVRAVDLLEAAAQRHPLDELVQGVLIEALVAAGRQAAALDAYRLMRDRLLDDLGVEPGPALRRSYLKVLRQETRSSEVSRGSASDGHHRGVPVAVAGAGHAGPGHEADADATPPSNC